MNRTYPAPFTTRGPVRGACGHNHRSWEAAARCALSDDRACRGSSRPGFGAYSDRKVYAADGVIVPHIVLDGTPTLLDADGLP